MPAAGEHDEALAADVDHQRLLVEDRRVGLPPPVAPGLVVGHPALEVGGAVDLPGDEHRAVEQQRGLPALDHLEALGLQRRAAQRRQLPRRLVGQREAAFGPHQRMHGERQPAAAPQLGQPGQPARVIEVAVAEHHDLDVARVEAEPVEVGRHAGRGHSGVEQHGVRGAAAARGDERGEAVLGDQPGMRLAVHELRGVHRGDRGVARAPGRADVAHQRVVAVVHQRGDDDLVDRLQGYGIYCRALHRAGVGRGDLGRTTTAVTHSSTVHPGAPGDQRTWITSAAAACHTDDCCPARKSRISSLILSGTSSVSQWPTSGSDS